MLSKKDFRLIASFLFFILAVVVSRLDIDEKDQSIEQNFPNESTTNIQTETNIPETYKVTRIIDGDTIELENGQKVRYIGMDTPETVAPNKPDGCFGKEASNKNRELVEGKTVRLEKDVNETDRYGRLLRYVYVDDMFVNEYLVREGYAFSVSYPPDIKMQEQLKEAEKYARETSKGLWGACEIKPTDATN
jgi:micrococcal nuclease